MRIIVPFAAGGPADVYARFLAQRLQESMGQSFVVDNRPGAGSIIGTDAVAKSPADGYTLLLMSNTHTVNESLIPTKPFQLLRDFAPIAPINASDLVLVTRPACRSNNLGELLKLAKAKPGGLSYASSGPGHAVPHGRRAVQGDGRRVDRPHPLPRQLGRAHRRARRPGRHDVRRGADDDRARQGRQGQGDGHDRHGALAR